MQHSIRAGLKASGHLRCKQDRFLFHAWLPRNPKGVETSRNFLREEVCWRVNTCFCVNGIVGEGQAEKHSDGAESQRVVSLPEHVRGSSYISKVPTGGTSGTYGFPFPSLPFMWWRTACIMRTWTAEFSRSRRRTSSKSWYRSPFGSDFSSYSVFIRAPGLDSVYAMNSIMKANCTRCRSVGKMLGSWTQW